MNTKSSLATLRLVTAGLLLLGTGCQTVERYSLTYRLWDNEDLRKWSEPAPNPNLALFETTNRTAVLVQYDALSEKRSTVLRRTFYLYPNQARIASATKPKWVKPSLADGMKPIAVLPAQSAATNRPPALSAYAVVSKEAREFTLYWPRELKETFALPVYAETSGTPTRVLLTPFAVAGDAVLVGVVAGVVGFLMWIESGAPTH